MLRCWPCEDAHGVRQRNLELNSECCLQSWLGPNLPSLWAGHSEPGWLHPSTKGGIFEVNFEVLSLTADMF